MAPRSPVPGSTFHQPSPANILGRHLASPSDVLTSNSGYGGGASTVSNGSSPVVGRAVGVVHPPNKIKCVFLGDGAVGKTSLIVSYTTNGYPSEYVPTAIDTYDVVVHVDGDPVTFEMCDTPGQEEFDSLRPLVYPNTDVFLLCFSVVIPSSFHNIRQKWMPEIRRNRNSKLGGSGSPPIVLVGTQSDLRSDAGTLVELRRFKEQPVTESEAKKLASHFNFESYVESSSLTQKNLKEVFDRAIVAGLKGRALREERAAKKRPKNSRGCLNIGCTLL